MRTKRSIAGQLYYYYKRGREHWANVTLILSIATLVGVYREDIAYWLGMPLHIFLILVIPVAFGLILVVGWLDVTRGILADEMRFTALQANPISAENYERLKRIETGILALNRNLAQVREAHEP